MNLDRLHNLFKRQRLSRADVDRYGKSSDPIEKNSIEECLDGLKQMNERNEPVKYNNEVHKHLNEKRQRMIL